VYDVGIEALNRIAKLSGPKPEQRIKTEVLFDGNGCAAPLDLQARICAPSELTIVVIAMYNQHGLARGFGECRKLAAGSGNSIGFDKAIGE